jgi:hypothetical protein
MIEKEINLNFEKFNHVMPHLARGFFFVKYFVSLAFLEIKRTTLLFLSPILEGNASAIQKAKR